MYLLRSVAGALPHSHAAIEDALVRLTQREPLHRTTPVLLDFLRLLLSVSVFWQFGNEFIVLLQSDAGPCLAADAVNSGLFPLKTTLFHHSVEGSPLGWFFALFFAPLLVSIPDGLDGNLFVRVQHAHFFQEVVEKIIVGEQGSSGGLDRF